MIDDITPKQIRAARAYLRLTTLQFAAATGLTGTTICNVENGKTKRPHGKTGEKIADFLLTQPGIHLLWLGKGKPPILMLD